MAVLRLFASVRVAAGTGSLTLPGETVGEVLAAADERFGDGFASLAGTRLGIIDDSKRNADVLLEELAEILRTRYEITEVKWHRKPSASRPADPTALKELTEQVDSVIIAIGD